MKNIILEKSREQLLDKFIDDVTEHCEKYNLKLPSEMMFLLTVMIKSNIEVLSECEKINENKNSN